jgi:integrase
MMKTRKNRLRKCCHRAQAGKPLVYTLKELMEFMGHSDLQMVQRYTKLLPQPEEADPAERLDAYLDGRRRG